MPAATESTRHAFALDMMGADKGSEELLLGVLEALKATRQEEVFYLCGQAEVLQPLLTKHRLTGDKRIVLHGASEVIEMDEKPIQSLKRKKDSSLVRAVELVKAGTCSAAISCGNTGSLMACGTLKLRPMEGLERPALVSVWPGRKQFFVMVDVGANPSARPEHLVHNAILGSHYARLLLGREEPTVGLLTIGVEEGKGNPLVQEAHEYLKACTEAVHYQGLVEGFHVFNDEVDVIVCDGFTGNVLLKTCESLYGLLKNKVRDELKRNPVRMLGALLARGAFKALKRDLNPDAFAGAPLLGLRGNVIKAHGSSSRHAFAGAIEVARKVVDYDFAPAAQRDLAKANGHLRPQAEEAATA